MRSDQRRALNTALARLPLRRPLRLTPNRVYRFYRGGALLDVFRGVPEPADSDHPEDWVASVTRAWTPPGAPPSDAGLSQATIDGGVVALADLLSARPRELAGADVVDRWGATTALLVKMLDSAIRLPVHCHPSRTFAERVLGSRFGKAEAWLFLDTRTIPGEATPHIRLGWRRDVGRDELRRWIEREETEPLLDAMHRVDVAAGDAWFVPPGTPHAIGAGALIVELQEPTDFSVVAETRGYPIAPSEASLGLGWDVMLDAFDRRARGEAELLALRQAAGAWADRRGAWLRPLLGPDTGGYFRALELRVPDAGDVAWPLEDAFAVLVVTAGAATLAGPDGSVDVRGGATVAIPAVAARALRIVGARDLSLIACLPPGPAPV